MQNYNSLIYEALKGSSPEEKYTHLMAMMKLLRQIAYPCRGQAEESWVVMDMAEQAAKHIDQHGNYE